MKEIFIVTQLLSSDGLLMSYEEFIQKFGFPVTVNEFYQVIDSIPTGVVNLYRGSFQPCTVSVVNPLNTVCGKVCVGSHKSNNRATRELFMNEISTKPYITTYWAKFNTNIPWTKVWLLPHKYMITNKAKEVSFKTLHKIYPVKHFMQKFKNDTDVNCSFCSVQPETVNHIFWHCNYTERLWKDIAKCISDKLYMNFNLHFEHVIFGFHSDTTEDLDKVFVINLVLLYAKFHIHRAKFAGDKPIFSVFYKCFELYLQSLTPLENKKAIKTKNICEKFNIGR